MLDGKNEEGGNQMSGMGEDDEEEEEDMSVVGSTAKK